MSPSELFCYLTMLRQTSSRTIQTVYAGVASAAGVSWDSVGEAGKCELWGISILYLYPSS